MFWTVDNANLSAASARFLLIFLSIILPSHTPHDKFIAIPAIDNNVLTLNFNP